MPGGKRGFERMRIDPIRIMAGSLSTTLVLRMCPVRLALNCYCSATVLVSAPSVVLPLTLLLL
jgi:hypothetical protein